MDTNSLQVSRWAFVTFFMLEYPTSTHLRAQGSNLGKRSIEKHESGKKIERHWRADNLIKDTNYEMG